MKKEISPEMFNYNKFPGPTFISFDNLVKSDDLMFTILENEKDAFDTTSFGQRFTEILLKYDYIVGDWGNEQLRLKGFYKDSNHIKKSNRISRLEDYIKEFCNFGCAYFVLENSNPTEIKFEEDKPLRRKKGPVKTKKRKLKADDSFKLLTKSNHKVKKDKKSEGKANSRKGKSLQKSSPQKQGRAPKQQVTPQNDHFIIRKKDKNP